MNSLAALEAVLFVAEAPVPATELAEVLELPRKEVEDLLEALGERLSAEGSGLVLKTTAGGWRIYTKPEAYPYLERFASAATSRKMSSAALETLAVVAYRQPIARSQIAEVRGVDSDSAVRTLERMGLIEEKERLSLPGNPAVYRTTPLFLEKLGLQSLQDLPPLADHIPAADYVETIEDSLRPGHN